MRDTVLVLGSGPIRIGQGIEFDYSCVHCVWSLRDLGYRAIIVNNNPETVSTDFDTGDGLYFEPVTLEDVMDVVRHENPMGVVCQFGGQTAINLAEGLERYGVKVLGTSPKAIAMAEDREQFENLLESLGISRPHGKAVRSLDEALVAAGEIGYPVLVRPSFVLGGRAMEIVFSDSHLREFYSQAEEANPGQPVLVDKYLLGIEAEVDVISDGEDTLVPGLMEHIERAGVHSGDSMAVYPSVSLTQDVQAQIVTSACKIARALGIKGLMNIQFVVVEGKAFVLEVNPRASRTVPYLSKVTGIPMVELATRCMMGEKLRELGYESGLWTLQKSFDYSNNAHVEDELLAIREEIKHNPGADWTLRTASARSKLRPFEFTRCWKEAFGDGFSEFVDQQRWSERVAIGGDSACHLAEVADQFGLESNFVAPNAKRQTPFPAYPGHIIPEAAFLDATTTVPPPTLYAVKAPVFSFQKLGKVEPSLGPEMKSTGEILGIDRTFEAALYKAMVASGIHFKGDGLVIVSVRNQDKDEAVRIAKGLSESGREIAATPGTADVLAAAGIPVQRVKKIQEGSPNLLELILEGRVSLMINSPELTETSESHAARIRRACIETGIPCITSIDTASALVRALDVFSNPELSSCLRLEEYFA